MNEWIEFSLASFCKMRCDYCPQSLYASNYGKFEYMSEDTFKKCLANVPPDFLIHFSGFAEPWLNPNATEFLKMTNSQDREVHIYSTLMGMKIEDAKEVCAATKVSKICIHTPDTQGLMKAKVDDEYIEKLKYIFANADRNRTYIEVMCIGEVHPQVEAVCNAHNIRTGFSKYEALISRASNVEYERVQKVESKTGKLICKRSPHLKQNVLVPNGDLYLCCCDYGLKHKLGNLATQSYSEIYANSNSKMIGKMMTRDSDVICRKCEWSHEL